jgi:hypothetical protein
MYLVWLFQISPKFFKIQPSRPKARQRESKKKTWISLDSLGGNEPFQRVALTPRAKNLSWLHSPRNWPSHEPRFRFGASGQGITISDSHKEKSIASENPAAGMSGRFS